MISGRFGGKRWAAGEGGDVGDEMRGWEVAREEGVATRDGRDGWTSESDVTRLPVGLCMANATEDNKGMHYQNSDENGEGVKITHITLILTWTKFHILGQVFKGRPINPSLMVRLSDYVIQLHCPRVHTKRDRYPYRDCSTSQGGVRLTVKRNKRCIPGPH